MAAQGGIVRYDYQQIDPNGSFLGDRIEYGIRSAQIVAPKLEFSTLQPQ
jgi:hypothetical protein